MSDRATDLLVFTVELALIAAFLIILKKGVGVRFSIAEFFGEFRELMALQPSNKALNALGILVLAIVGIVPVLGATLQPWRQMAYDFLGVANGQTPVTPIFSILGLVGGFIVFFALGSMLICGRGAEPGRGVILQLKRRSDLD